jgi:hypothetical protein
MGLSSVCAFSSHRVSAAADRAAKSRRIISVSSLAQLFDDPAVQDGAAYREEGSLAIRGLQWEAPGITVIMLR